MVLTNTLANARQSSLASFAKSPPWLVSSIRKLLHANNTIVRMAYAFNHKALPITFASVLLAILVRIRFQLTRSECIRNSRKLLNKNLTLS